MRMILCGFICVRARTCSCAGACVQQSGAADAPALQGGRWRRRGAAGAAPPKAEPPGPGRNTAAVGGWVDGGGGITQLGGSGSAGGRNTSFTDAKITKRSGRWRQRLKLWVRTETGCSSDIRLISARAPGRSPGAACAPRGDGSAAAVRGPARLGEEVGKGVAKPWGSLRAGVGLHGDVEHDRLVGGELRPGRRPSCHLYDGASDRPATQAHCHMSRRWLSPELQCW